MNNKINFLKSLFLPLFLILFFTINITNDHIFDIFSRIGQQASVIKSTRVENIYNISPSKNFPGVFNFKYQYAKLPTNKKEANFDLPILPFDEEKARAILKQEYGLEYVDFGPIRDAWGYPVRENAFMKKEEIKKQSFLDSLKTNKALAYDEDTQNPGVYNCRANTSVTGYFKAYFEDVALNTNVGFDDPVYGDGRREEACQVLEDMSELLMLDTTTVTPDILFMRSDQSLPLGALAAASSYLNNSAYFDNGTIHKHIISRQDPTPGAGNFDAFIITNFNGINWSVDSSLNQNTYDFYTIMWHEVMHVLGFRSRLPGVISQTGIPFYRGTFDQFIYRNSGNINSTIFPPHFSYNAAIINIPIGAPPEDFVLNEMVYKGQDNIYNNVDVTNNIPIYSPTYWQQGSSLSHFDMDRAQGQTYVMHPFIGTNTEREIHEHEKEVLCHLGYQVEDICEMPSTPVSNNNTAIMENGEACIYPTNNDYQLLYNIANLRLASVSKIKTSPGDTILFYSSADCSGAAYSSVIPNTKSFKFISSPGDLESIRIFEYRNYIPYLATGSLINKASFPSYVIILPECQIDNNPYEYVCNGDFEMPPADVNSISFLEYTDTSIPYWCCGNIITTSNSIVQSISQSNIYNGTYLIKTHFNPFSNTVQSRFTRLKQPLIAGQEYVLSIDSAKLGCSNNSDIYVGLISDLDDLPSPSGTGSGPPTIIDQLILFSPSDLGDWSNNTITFVPNDNYQFLVLWGYDDSPLVSGTPLFFFDNISIRPAGSPPPPPPPLTYYGAITGNIYQDLNQNGSYQSSTELRLSGIPVGLFQAGNSTPIQTTTTQDIPNLGKYEFTNLPDGDYYVGLIGENLYQSVTQPAVSTDPFSNYNHMHTVTLEDGETIGNLDFGVVLVGDTIPVNTNGKVDIKVTKELVDSSLSLFDRYITWRIDVRNIGDSLATNVLVKEVIPSGLVYHTHQTPNPNTYDSNVHMLHVPALIPNQQTHIFITMKVPNTPKVCGNKTNIAVLHDLDQLDSNNTNNEGSATIKLQKCRTTVAPEIQVK